MTNKQIKRLALLNFLIKAPTKPVTDQARLAKLWRKELKQLQQECK